MFSFRSLSRFFGLVYRKDGWGLNPTLLNFIDNSDNYCWRANFRQDIESKRYAHILSKPDESEIPNKLDI